MARPGVTYQEVVEAANELVGKGRNPTVEQVRLQIGSGSSTTIANHLRQWKANQEATSLLSIQENIPKELVAVMKGLWEQMLNQSQTKISQVEASYQEAISELQKELDKYKINNQKWQKLFNQWQQEKNLLANEKLTLEQALEFSHKENHSLHNKNDMLLNQLQEKQTRIEELHRLHQQAQANLEHYRESAREQRLLDQQQFEREKQQFLFENKELKEQLIIQKIKYTELYQQSQLKEQSYIELENKHHQSESLAELLKDKIQQLEKTNIVYQQTSQHWQNQFKDSQTAFEIKYTEIITLQGDNKILSQQLIDMQGLIQHIQDQNKLLASEKWELVQEKAHLEGQIKQMQKMITA